MRVINYLSFSSMATFEMSPEKWVRQYIYGEKQRITRNMSFGSKLAYAMENDELSGDPALDIMMSKLPKLDQADKIVEDEEKGIEIFYPHDGKKYVVPFLVDKKIKIPLVAKPDSAKNDYSKFIEYKTSTRLWTEKMVSESGQLSFYATAIWLKTGKIPEDIELVCVVVKYNEDGSLTPTGEMKVYKTKRTMVDIIKMCARMRRAWLGIQKLCENELL